MSAVPSRDVDLAEAVARRVVELLDGRTPQARWLTADDVARLLAVDRAYVYDNADKLGGRRLGDGPRARLRFRLEDVEAALPCLSSRGAQSPEKRMVEPRQRRRSAPRLGTGTPLLPIRGQKPARGQP